LGMAWLHGNKLIHRDLKPTNILLDEHWNAKICDFGLSDIKKYIDGHKEDLGSKDRIKRSLPWMAPEIFLGKEIDERTDVYAIGIIIWQLMTTQTEVYPLSQFITEEELTKGVAVEQTRPKIPTKIVLRPIRKLIEKCWAQEKEKRPYLPDLINMLDKAWVDSLITDPIANSFWKEYFLGRESVSWKQFATPICKFLNENKEEKKKIGQTMIFR